jgi:hypothetical protein
MRFPACSTGFSGSFVRVHEWLHVALNVPLRYFLEPSAHFAGLICNAWGATPQLRPGLLRRSRPCMSDASDAEILAREAIDTWGPE